MLGEYEDVIRIAILIVCIMSAAYAAMARCEAKRLRKEIVAIRHQVEVRMEHLRDVADHLGVQPRLPNPSGILEPRDKAAT